MTQTKKKSEKKQPISVQLSKDDLKELLVVLKDFMVEEIFANFKLDIHHQMDCLNRRIVELEKAKRSQEPKRVSLCPHEDRFKSIWYSAINNRVLGLKFECRRCGREWIKTTILLSWGEKRSLRKLGVKI